METTVTYAADTTAHNETNARLRAVHSILDQMQVQPGELLFRLSKTRERDDLIRQLLSLAMGTRLKASEELKTLISQLSVPPTPGLCANILKHQATLLQVELERIVADLAVMDPDYLQVEPVRELVMASQELMDCTEDILTDMYDCFVKGDPLLKRLRHSKAKTFLALATIRSKRAYGAQS